MVGADAEAGEAAKRDEPKVGAEEGAAEEEKREEPKAGAAEEAAAAGWENEKADGAVDKEKGEDAVDPAAAEEPNAKEVAMAATACGRWPIWADFWQILAWFCRCLVLGRAA